MPSIRRSSSLFARQERYRVTRSQVYRRVIEDIYVLLGLSTSQFRYRLFNTFLSSDYAVCSYSDCVLRALTQLPQYISVFN